MLKFKHIFCFVFLLGCERAPLSSCVLMKEMGSKKHPFKVAFTNEGSSVVESNFLQKERPSFANLRSCFEREAGISVAFEFTESENSALSGLESDTFQFAILNSLSFGVSENFEFDKVVLVSRPEQERLSRSVLLGLADSWKTSSEIFNTQNIRLGYESPQSDFGFLIPRHLLLTQRFFPEETLFAWTPEGLVEELDKKTVDAIAVSSDFLFSKYGESLGERAFVSLIPGLRFDRFVVFLVSPPLPRKSLVASRNVQVRYAEKFQEWLPKCLSNTSVEFAEKVFGAQTLSPPRLGDFEFIGDVASQLKNFPKLNPFYGRESN